MQLFVARIFDGIANGSAYALIAIGARDDLQGDHPDQLRPG